MAPIQIPGVENLPLITGPFILGYLWSYCLYGVLIVQVYMYAEKYAHDRAAVKILVWTLFLLETVFTVFMTIAAWNMFGAHWGDTDAILVLDWSWTPLPPLSSFMGGMAQTFYAWRIYCLTRSFWLPVIIELVMLMQLTATFVFSVRYFGGDRLVLNLFDYSDEITVWLAGSAACDLIITVTLVVILYRRKPDTAGQHAAFRSTADLINKLIRFNMETGMATSLSAIIELALFLSTHQYNLHLIFFLILGKLYSNTLMATLNYRNPIGQSHHPDVVLQSAFWADGETNLPRTFGFQHSLDVRCASEVLTELSDVMLEEFSSVDDEESRRRIQEEKDRKSQA